MLISIALIINNMKINYAGRVFLVNQKPELLLDSYAESVMDSQSECFRRENFDEEKFAKAEEELERNTFRVFPRALEELYIEKGVKVSKINEYLSKNPSYLNLNNIFKTSDSAALEVRHHPMPGLTIRYDDDFIPNHHEITDVRGYENACMQLAVLAEYICDTPSKASPKVYYGFNSRNFLFVKEESLDDFEDSDLAKKTKEAFREFILQDTVIFELLTTKGVVKHKPDLELLEYALISDVDVGLSKYKHTVLDASKYVIKKLSGNKEFEKARKNIDKASDKFKMLTRIPSFLSTSTMDYFFDKMDKKIETELVRSYEA